MWDERDGVISMEILSLALAIPAALWLLSRWQHETVHDRIAPRAYCLVALVDGQRLQPRRSSGRAPGFLNAGKTDPVVKTTNYWSDSGVRPGGQITLALVLDIRKPYHIYSNKAQGSLHSDHRSSLLIRRPNPAEHTRVPATTEIRVRA